MRIYPPYNIRKVEVANPESFYKYLLENIELKNSNNNAILKGNLGKDNFIVERKFPYYNTNRPQIKGFMVNTIEGKQTLTLSIESNNYLLYIVIIFSILLTATAIYNASLFLLIGIPLSVLSFYLGGFVLHSVDLKKTKIELEKIIQEAKYS